MTAADWIALTGIAVIMSLLLFTTVFRLGDHTGLRVLQLLLIMGASITAAVLLGRHLGPAHDRDRKLVAIVVAATAFVSLAVGGLLGGFRYARQRQGGG